MTKINRFLVNNVQKIRDCNTTVLVNEKSDITQS